MTVLILSYNHGRYLEGSVRSALDQDGEKIRVDVVVLDDGSTDESLEVLARLEHVYGTRLHVLREPHRGPTAIGQNFNRLVRSARGEFVAFLASDDEFLQHRFDEQLEILRREPRVQIVYADGLDRDTSGRCVGRSMTPASRRAWASEAPELALAHVLSQVPAVFLQSVLVRRSFLDSFTAFDDELIADDWVFNIRVMRRLIDLGLGFRHLGTPVFIRNLHDRNTTNDTEVHTVRVMQVIDKYFQEAERRRLLARLRLIDARDALRRRRWLDAVRALVGYVALDPAGRVLIGELRQIQRKANRR